MSHLRLAKLLRTTFLTAACLSAAFSTDAHAQSLVGEAYSRAAAAYDALAKNDLVLAENEARAAFSLRPDSPDAARLLMDVLNRRGETAAAIAIADQAVASGAADAELYLARAYLNLNSNSTVAISDFEKALSANTLPADKVSSARLGIADAAAATKQPARVVEVLSPLGAQPSYDIQARLGFAYFDLNQMPEAEAAFSKAAAAARTPTEKNTALKGQAQAQANLGNNAAVREIVTTLMTASDACDFDLVYLLLRIGDDETALATFNGRCAGSMTSATELDAAYAAKRLNRNDEAALHFSRALALDRTAAKPEFDVQKTFALRREVETLNRTFGANGTLAYRADRPVNAGGSGGQAVVEGYWQPPNIGNQAGRIFQIYSRVSLNTLGAGGSTVETNSTQGALGVRYKPLADTNFIVAGEHFFKIGSGAISDWLLRAGYSASLNTDIEPISGTQATAQLYAEGDYFLNQGRTIGVIEGRYGFERQVFLTSQNLRASVFVNGTANYDSGERREVAAAAGPGVGLRYWFRESADRAPASYVQFDVIYRLSATKSKRLGGLTLQMSFGL